MGGITGLLMHSCGSLLSYTEIKRDFFFLGGGVLYGWGLYVMDRNGPFN